MKDKNATKKELTICLAGNPNSGKTTLFNKMTGSRQKIGNYPGVTVEKVEGYFEYKGYKINLIDLPGTYSLTAYSLEELVTRDFLIDEKPDLVIDVVDSTNIERSLYLALQIKELQLPIVTALNKWDLLDSQDTINIPDLEQVFGSKFIPTVADKEQGIEQLFDVAIKIATGQEKLSYSPVRYNKEIEYEIDKLVLLLKNEFPENTHYDRRWMAVKLLENDKEVLDKCATFLATHKQLQQQTEKSHKHIEKVFGEDTDIVFTEERYAYIRGALKESTITTVERKLDLSDKIDKLVLNRFIGLPIFGMVMFIIFYIPFSLGAPLADLVEGFFSNLAALLQTNLPQGLVRDLLVDGVIGGVGGVLVFVPQIMLLFACISFLEASGYMARAAFVVDKFMHKLGLHGKSFVPMIVGFGCTVPALLATRTLENRSDRLTTMMAAPFMSCSARFPVYVLFIAATVPQRYAGFAMFGIYLLGIAVAIFTAKLFRRFVYKGEQSHFVMELPPYRIPTITGVIHQMWEKAWYYLKKAGTLLVFASILFWFLTNYPKPSKEVATVKTKKIAALQASYNKSLLPIATKLKISNSKNRSKSIEQHPKVKKISTELSKINSSFALQTKEAKHNSAAYQNAVNQKRILLLSLKQQNPKLVDLINQYQKIKQQYHQSYKKIVSDHTALDKKQSYAGRVGQALTPILSPLGLDDWRISVALISGFAAKEVIISTLGAIYGLSEDSNENSDSLRQRVQHDPFFQSKQAIPAKNIYTKNNRYFMKDCDTEVYLRNGRYYTSNLLVIFSFLAFVLLYVPCQAAVIVYIKEAGWKHALLMVGYSTAVAYIVSMLVYQVGSLLGLG